MNGGMILAGAAGRLLPASLPFRFFVAAVYFHLVAWGALALAAFDVIDFVGGLGAPLVAIHAATLGVFCMAAMGATFQLLPVATRAPIGALWKPKLIFILMIIGVHQLLVGMFGGAMVMLKPGAILVAVALAYFILLTAGNLRAAPQSNVAIAYAWVAIMALLALAVTGVLIAFDFDLGWLSDHSAVVGMHLAFGIFGFFGILIFGFSTILLPMFALAPSPKTSRARLVLALAGIAVLLAAGGLGARVASVVVVAFVVGLGATVLHVVEIERVLKLRMRRKLDLAFALVRFAHGALMVGLMGGGALAAGIAVPGGWTLFGWIVIGGWLMTFLFGILQRIMPFLASMHAGKIRGRPPLLSEIGPPRLLHYHAIAHFLALAGIAIGIAIQQPLLVRIGAVVGCCGAVAFGWFAFVVVSHLMPVRPPAPTST